MANNGGQNVPNAKEDFNKAAKNELNQKAEAEKAKTPASQVQINKLDGMRPKKEFKHELTPTGSITKEVNAAENAKANAEIDKQQNDFRERMKKQQGKTKEAFERATDNSKGR